MFHPVEPDPEWTIGKYGLLNVQGEVRDGRTVLEPKGWRIPFQWQGYHYQDHDDEPFLLLVNSGGGLVEGDVSHFCAMLGAKTRTLITTTAASKFYKSIGGGRTREIVDIQLGPCALLEYYPDEAIPFKHSRVERTTRVNITEFLGSSQQICCQQAVFILAVVKRSNLTVCFPVLKSDLTIER